MGGFRCKCAVEMGVAAVGVDDLSDGVGESIRGNKDHGVRNFLKRGCPLSGRNSVGELVFCKFWIGKLGGFKLLGNNC